ncbi:hypothetical protein DSM02_3173 [Leeuwenhoekiella polynyae]|uniref:Uncharacterized protein n=1 Tax=Leeuwenhoekiella polynyae TaxID=1550906 RepID=A0A4V1KPS1_9FLAO|nr:hypothetical protein DSM02_3173 [Leeuwenhoekiella polynyae]
MACYSHVDFFDFQNDSLRETFKNNISPELFILKVQETLNTQIKSRYFSKEELRSVLVSIHYSNDRQKHFNRKF